MQSARRENGNVLFIILIGVMLFAALMYAITRSSTGSQTISKEQAEVAADEIIDSFTAVKMAVARLRSLNACADTQISFENAVVSGYANSNAPADKSCHLFDAGGAGLQWISPPAAANTSASIIYGGSSAIVGVVQAGNGPGDNKELLMFVPVNNVDICKSLNSRLGVTGIQSDWADFSKFVGTYKTTQDYLTPIVSGTLAACFSGVGGHWPVTSGANYFFYGVLIAR
jgi:hypothetical protein